MWIILLICILCNVSLAIIFKLFARYDVNILQAIVVNYFVCVLVATCVLGEFPLSADDLSASWFPYSAFLAVIFIFGFNITAMTYKYFGVGFTAIMQRMSLIFPVAFAILYYHEAAGFIKLIGLFLAFLSIWLINIKKDEKLLITKKWYWALPFLTLFMAGLIETVFLFVEKEGIVASGDLGFVAGIFFMAGLLGLLAIIFNAEQRKTFVRKKELIAGIALGVPNFFTIYLLVTLLDMGVDGSFFFPMNNISVIVLSALAGLIFFKESLNVYRVFGFLSAVLAILILAWTI